MCVDMEDNGRKKQINIYLENKQGYRATLCRL